MRTRTLLAPASLVSLLLSCSAEAARSPAIAADALEGLRAHVQELGERSEHGAETVEVQHILISFEGADPRVAATRTRDEAERLAAELFARIRAGKDFDGLVRDHTDDAYPGIYALTTGKPASQDVYPRRLMAPGFGDASWRLAVGEVGVAAWVPVTCPIGWHIIKRLQ